jgi:hypothetical protein
MSSQHPADADTRARGGRPSIDRLLFVSDAAVGDIDELSPAVRSIIDAASRIYVLTPTLPGRLAWLADDVDRFRQFADVRLDTVLRHMHSIGADASGVAAHGPMMSVIADAVTEHDPDHILFALRDSDHANWQERRLPRPRALPRRPDRARGTTARTRRADRQTAGVRRSARQDPQRDGGLLKRSWSAAATGSSARPSSPPTVARSSRRSRPRCSVAYRPPPFATGCSPIRPWPRGSTNSSPAGRSDRRPLGRRSPARSVTSSGPRAAVVDADHRRRFR